MNTLHESKQSKFIIVAVDDNFKFRRLEVETEKCVTYLVHGCEVGCAVLVDIFRLVAQHLAHKVVQDVGEAAWDWELLNVLACHCESVSGNLNYHC